jgi:MFS transporter, DHA2 family, multidrug resistance protein
MAHVDLDCCMVRTAYPFFIGFGALLVIVQYLQLGLSPLQAGLWSLPSSAAFIVGSMLTLLPARRASPATVMVAGLAVAAGRGLGGTVRR